MLDAVLQGMLMGLILSTFCGPIFFMLIDLGISGTVKSVFYLAASVFLCDALIVFFLLFVALSFVSNLKSLEMLYYIGGSVLIYFGIRNILKKTQIAEQHEEFDQKRLNKILLKGFVVNLLNPNILFFWFGAITLALSTYHNDKKLVIVHFICGLTVSFLTDFLKGFSAFHLKQYIKPPLVKFLNKLSGIIIIFFGLKLIFFH